MWPSVDGPLFRCAFDGGEWPARKDVPLEVSRSGPNLVVDGRSLPLTRVDKSGPHSGYVDYTLLAGGESFNLSAYPSGGSTKLQPAEAIRRGEPSDWWVCRERMGTGGLFDDAALDALVTATNGKRSP